MTYAEAKAIRSAIEASLLSGAGVSSIQIGDRQVTYNPLRAAELLAQLNRDIAAYERKASNLNPHVKIPDWNS